MLHYQIKGQGSPLVLLHGFPMDSEAWQNVIPALSVCYQLILIDLPGAGKSSLTQGGLTIAMMAQAVWATIDTLGLDKVAIAGHSMGGYTAIEMAHQQPQRLSALCLVHTSAYADTAEKIETRKKAIRLIQKGRDGQEMFLKGAAPNMFAPTYANQHPEALDAYVKKGMELPGENLVQFYEAIIGRSNHTEVLQQAKFPIQWIIGAQDQIIPKQDALEQSRLSQIIDVQLYQQGGHLSMVEMPERLANDMLQFLEKWY